MQSCFNVRCGFFNPIAKIDIYRPDFESSNFADPTDNLLLEHKRYC